jgi:hypothetical protein
MSLFVIAQTTEAVVRRTVLVCDDGQIFFSLAVFVYQTAGLGCVLYMFSRVLVAVSSGKFYDWSKSPKLPGAFSFSRRRRRRILRVFVGKMQVSIARHSTVLGKDCSLSF